MQGLLLSMKEITLLCGMRGLLKGKTEREEKSLRATAAVVQAAALAAVHQALLAPHHLIQRWRTQGKVNQKLLIRILDLMVDVTRREVGVGKEKTRVRSKSKAGELT